MASPYELRQVLTMIERGLISAEEAAQLLSALGAAEETEADAQDTTYMVVPNAETHNQNNEKPIPSNFQEFKLPADQPSTSSGEDPEISEVHAPTSNNAETPDLTKWRRYWLVPFGIGAVIIILGASLMYQAIENSGFGFWFYCSWLPFLLGVAVLALGWHSRTARWLHLRIEQAKDEWPRRIAFSFPLPLRFTGWIIRIMGDRIPNLERAGLHGKHLDELILGIERYATPETPLSIEVNEEGEDRVFIYIG